MPLCGLPFAMETLGLSTCLLVSGVIYSLAPLPMIVLLIISNLEDELSMIKASLLPVSSILVSSMVALSPLSQHMPLHVISQFSTIKLEPEVALNNRPFSVVSASVIFTPINLTVVPLSPSKTFLYPTFMPPVVSPFCIVKVA